MIRILLILMFCTTAFAGEREEVQRLAHKYNAQVEVRLWDRTRVDMINDKYAIEVDWAHKWAEGIGQSLYYAEVTGKKPALILLCSDLKKSGFFIYRAQTVCAKHGIKLYVEWLQ